MSTTDRSYAVRIKQIYCRSLVECPPTSWSKYPATHDVNMDCHSLVDVSGINFCDGTYIGSGASFDISANQVLVLSGKEDPSGAYGGAAIVTNDRIRQILNIDSSWNTVNGYYSLAKDAAPALNPSSTGAKAVSTWTIRTTPNNNNWSSVIWAPELGLFAAVSTSGSGNRVMTSPNGIVWTQQTSAANNSWSSICWSRELGIFAAVSSDGLGNRVMTSPDGIIWTSQTSAANNSWSSICWSPELGLFVAVATTGTDNRVMTSADGIVWTSRTSAADNSWSSVCWSPELGLFAAVSSDGSGNRIMTSPDGIVWTSQTSPADNSWNSVCWSSELGIFVAVAAELTSPVSLASVMTSPDGINWTWRAPATTNNWRSVCWSPELGLFVAVAFNTSSGSGYVGTRIMSSPDGITWTTRTSPIVGANDINWSSICWSPELGIFVSVATSGTTNRAITSSLTGRPPTSYNVFDSSFNQIDQSGNWTFRGNTTVNNLARGVLGATRSGAGVTIADNESWIVCDGSTNIILPSAADFPGRELMIKNIGSSGPVTSSASNVVPLTSATAGTAILPAASPPTVIPTATLVSDGSSNWIIMR